MRYGCIVTFAVWGLSASACSGLHVQETIHAADEFGQLGAAFTLVVALVSWGLRRHRALYVALAASILHPAWILSSRFGDCGGTKINATILVGTICGGTLLWDALRRPTPVAALAKK